MQNAELRMKMELKQIENCRLNRNQFAAWNLESKI
jgi:hypothetical protein